MEVGKLSSFNLEKDFKPFYYELTTMSGINGTPGINQCNRIIHNEEQIVRCRLRDYTPPRAEVKYFNMDGSAAAQFTLMSGSAYVENVFDMCWSNTDDKYIYLVGQSPSGIGVYRGLSNGTYYDTIIENFMPDEGNTWAWGSLYGRVQVAAGEEDYYIKVGGSVYRIPIATTGSGYLDTTGFYDSYLGSTLSGSEVPGGYSGVYLKNPYSFYPQNGDYCYDFAYQYAPYYSVPSGLTPSGCLVFTWYDSPIDTLYVRSISTSGNMCYNHERWALINVPSYSLTSKKWPVFLNQTDPYALHFLDGLSTTSGSSVLLKVFNLDETLAAFINLNSSDIVMPAGVGDTALITATVINCWGEPKADKTVEFWISSGDGSIIPIDSETDSLGKCRATFYGGANVGVTQINAVVNEI
jgi:hypothetical protein